MKTTPLILCFGAICFSPIAQAAPRAEIQQTKGIFFETESLVIDGKKIDRNWHGAFEVGTAMDLNPQAKRYLTDYYKYKKMEAWLIWGGLGLALTYLAITPKEIYSDSIYWGFFGSGFISSMLASRQANINLENAIDVYNQGETSAFQFYFSPSTNVQSAGLVFRF